MCVFYGNAHLVKPEKSKKFFSWEEQKQNQKNKRKYVKQHQKKITNKTELQ